MAIRSSSSSSGAGSGRRQDNRDSNVWNSWYQNYMSVAERYKGTEYYDLFMANPYLTFQQYSPTVGDMFASLFGSNAGADRFYQSRIDQGTEYMNKILAQIQAESHNSTSAQVARDRAAGLNPDLTGDVTSAGQTTPVPEDTTPPEFPTAGAESMQALGSIASTGLSFVNGILGFVQGCQSIGLNVIQGGVAQATMAKDMYDFILHDEAGNLPLPRQLDDGSYDFAGVPTTSLEAVYKKGNKKNPFTGRAAALYSKLRGSILYDKEGRPTSALERAWRENVAGAAGSTKSAAEAMSLPGFDFD